MARFLIALGLTALLALALATMLALPADADKYDAHAADYPGRDVPVGFVCLSLPAAVEGAKAMDHDRFWATQTADAKETELLREARCIDYPDNLNATVREVEVVARTRYFVIWLVDDGGHGRFLICGRPGEA